MSSAYFKTTHVKFDMRPLARLGKSLSRGPSPGSPLDKMYRQWGAYYLTFIRKRWTKASKSPGNPWPDLADSTKQSRRKSSSEQKRTRKVETKNFKKTGRMRSRTKNRVSIGKRKFSILKNTAILFNALYIGKAGNLFRVGDDGIDVGFGADATHKDGGKLTLGEIAQVHHAGTKTAGKKHNVTIPKRPILVQPRTHVKRQMSDALDVAIKRMLGG